MTLSIGPVTVRFPGLWGFGYAEGYPVTGDITSPFGWRPPIVTPAGVTNPFHSGMDIATAGGTPIIYPGGRGQVTAEGPALTGYGNAVFISDESGHQMLFAHLQPGAHVGKGQWLNRGQVVGQVGTTGASTGNHLHFGVMAEGMPIVEDVSLWLASDAWVDPRQFFAESIANTEIYPEQTIQDPQWILDFTHNSLLMLAANPPVDISAALRELGERIAYLRTLI